MTQFEVLSPAPFVLSLFCEKGRILLVDLGGAGRAMFTQIDKELDEGAIFALMKNESSDDKKAAQVLKLIARLSPETNK